MAVELWCLLVSTPYETDISQAAYQASVAMATWIRTHLRVVLESPE